MREILFRGKDIAGIWHYGDLINLTKEIKQICNHNQLEHAHSVNPETVGQYTGLTDKNGNKIFEGDIIKYYVWGSYECFAVVRIGEYEQDGSGDEYPAIKICGVYAEVKRYCPLIKEDGDYFPEYLKKSSLLEIGKDVFELVGNIHDNPELLKGGEG